MPNLKVYKTRREDLIFEILNAAGLAANLLPVDVRPGSKFARMGGNQWNNYDLMTISKKLQDVLYRFDQVQHALGLAHPDDARFGHGPAGSTNPRNPAEEKPGGSAGTKGRRPRKKSG
jgi:hypothetical protein